MGTLRGYSGREQPGAVRLLKQLRLNSEEVEIFRRGDEIVLREKDGTMVCALDLLADLPDDFDLTAAERGKDGAEAQGAVMEPRHLLGTNICVSVRQKRPEEVLRRFRKLRPGEAELSVI